MTARRARWIGGIAVAVCVTAYLLLLWLLYAVSHDWGDGYYLFPLLLGYPVVGAVIVSRKPDNTLGWLLVGAGTAIALGLSGAAALDGTLGATAAYWQQVAGWLANVAFISGFEGLVIALAFLYPTGRLLSPRWRPMAIGVWGVFFVTLAYSLLLPGPLGGYFVESPQLRNPFGINGLETLGDHLGFLLLPLGGYVVVACLLAIIARVYRSRGIERLQIQWFALAIAIVAAAVLVARMGPTWLPESWSWLVTVGESVFFVTASIGIPTAIGIAILRYRLYDIERLVNRGLVYIALSLTLVLVYLSLVLSLGALLRTISGQSSGVVVAISTLVSAALFRPLRAWIQRAVDRRFYRRNYDAARTVAAFSARLRDEIDLPALESELQQVVAQTMQPAHVSFWLRPPA